MSTAPAATPRTGIFVLEDESAIRLSDQATNSDARLLVETAPPLSPGLPGLPHDGHYTEIVNTAARLHRLAPELLQAVIDAESGGAVRAVSPRGAQGLMQLMPATARDYGVTDPFDPQQNVNAGAKHLRMLLDRFSQNPALALAAYNAGAETVVRHRNRIPPFAETTAYVSRVLAYVTQLRRTAASLPAPTPLMNLHRP